jgi:hypothetical protein
MTYLFFVSIPHFFLLVYGGRSGSSEDINSYFMTGRYLNVKIFLSLSNVVLTEIYEETAAFPNSTL